MKKWIVVVALVLTFVGLAAWEIGARHNSGSDCTSLLCGGGK